MLLVSIISSGKSRVPAPRWVALTFLHWGYGWYGSALILESTTVSCPCPSHQGQPAHRSGQVLVCFFWPTGLWTSRCSALCGVPLLWYLRFGETSELLDPYSCLHPGSPAYLPIPANACLPSSWVLIGIWAVFGMTVPIFLQFIALNLYNTAILPYSLVSLGFFQVTQAFAGHRVSYQVWCIKWDHTSAKQSLRLSHVLNLSLCIQWCYWRLWQQEMTEGFW